MYCNNCGKFLLENDKFCSNCGAKVAQSEKILDKDNQPEDATPDFSSTYIPKPTPPVDNIKWNISDFPGHDVKKTEEINFDWGNTEKVKKPEPTIDEIALNPGFKIDANKPTEGGFIAIDAIEEEVIRGKDLEEQIFAEASLVETIPTGGETHKRTKIVDKFYTFNKKNEEFQKLLDNEYEKIKTGEGDSLDEQSFRDRVTEINQKNDAPWPEFNPTEHIAEMALARDRFFGQMEDPYKTPPIETPQAAEPAEAPEPAEPAVPAEALEPAEPAVAVEAPEATEPSTLVGDEPLPEESILPDLEICNEEQAMSAYVAPPTFSTPLDEEPLPEDFNEPSVEPIIEETRGDEQKSTEPKTEDDVLSIRDKWVQYEEDESDDEQGHSGSKLGKFIIGFLILLLLTQVALLGIKLVAPESAVAQFVDDKVQQVMQFFSGDNNTSQAMVMDRSVAAEDKTGLIQMQIEKNYNGNIAIIKYNADLRLDKTKTYTDATLNQSTVLEDNEWFTKKDGTVVYYDDQVVGTVIAYESTKKLTDGEAFATLEIGEIRSSGDDLYVWVAEEITPGSIQQKFFRITVSGETMNVATEYDV